MAGIHGGGADAQHLNRLLLKLMRQLGGADDHGGGAVHVGNIVEFAIVVRPNGVICSIPEEIHGIVKACFPRNILKFPLLRGQGMAYSAPAAVQGESVAGIVKLLPGQTILPAVVGGRIAKQGVMDHIGREAGESGVGKDMGDLADFKVYRGVLLHMGGPAGIGAAAQNFNAAGEDEVICPGGHCHHRQIEADISGAAGFLVVDAGRSMHTAPVLIGGSGRHHAGERNVSQLSVEKGFDLLPLDAGVLHGAQSGPGKQLLFTQILKLWVGKEAAVGGAAYANDRDASCKFP